jgi:hypothetical protein
LTGVGTIRVLSRLDGNVPTHKHFRAYVTEQRWYGGNEFAIDGEVVRTTEVLFGVSHAYILGHELDFVNTYFENSFIGIWHEIATTAQMQQCLYLFKFGDSSHLSCDIE